MGESERGFMAVVLSNWTENTILQYSNSIGGFFKGDQLAWGVSAITKPLLSSCLYKFSVFMVG